MKDTISKADRERLKQASRNLLKSIREILARLDSWTAKEQTQAEVQVFILDQVYASLPTPPFTDEEKQAVAQRIDQHIWMRSVGSAPLAVSTRSDVVFQALSVVCPEFDVGKKRAGSANYH